MAPIRVTGGHIKYMGVESVPTLFTGMAAINTQAAASAVMTSSNLGSLAASLAVIRSTMAAMASPTDAIARDPDNIADTGAFDEAVDNFTWATKARDLEWIGAAKQDVAKSVEMLPNGIWRAAVRGLIEPPDLIEMADRFDGRIVVADGGIAGKKKAVSKKGKSDEPIGPVKWVTKAKVKETDHALAGGFDLKSVAKISGDHLMKEARRLFAPGRHEEAALLYEEARELYEAAGDVKKVADADESAASVLFVMGRRASDESDSGDPILPVRYYAKALGLLSDAMPHCNCEDAVRISNAIFRISTELLDGLDSVKLQTKRDAALYQAVFMESLDILREVARRYALLHKFIAGNLLVEGDVELLGFNSAGESARLYLNLTMGQGVLDEKGWIGGELRVGTAPTLFGKSFVNVSLAEASVLDRLAVAYEELGDFASAMVWYAAADTVIRQAAGLLETSEVDEYEADRKDLASAKSLMGLILEHKANAYLKMQNTNGWADELAASIEAYGDAAFEFDSLGNGGRAIELSRHRKILLQKAINFELTQDDELAVRLFSCIAGAEEKRFERYSKAAAVYESPRDTELYSRARLRAGEFAGLALVEMAGRFDKKGGLNRATGALERAYAVLGPVSVVYDAVNGSKSDLRSINEIYGAAKKTGARIQREAGNIGTALRLIEESEGAYRRAVELWGRKKASNLVHLHRISLADILRERAELFEQAGDRHAAAKTYEEAGRLYETSGYKVGAMEVMEAARRLNRESWFVNRKTREA